MGVVINTSDNSRVDVQDGGAPSVKISQGSVGGINLSMYSGTSVSFVSNTPSAVSVSGAEALAVKVAAPSAQAAVINSSLSIGYVNGKWGDLTGTITNQIDLVNYITSVLPDVPFETVADIVNALNQLDEFRLQSSVDFRPANFGIGDESNEYTFPLPLDVSEKYGYFLFSDNNGNLNWKQFPLDFIDGFDEGAKVDGGDF